VTPRLLLLLLLAILAGCDERTGPPARYDLHLSSSPPAASEAPGPHPDRITVGKGDTLYALQLRWGVPMRAIIDANNLKPPYLLVAGASLVLPQVGTHKVQAGDTLSGVARRYGVSLSTLAATNHIERPNDIRIGQVLVLPAPVQAGAPPPPLAMAVATAPVQASAPPAPPAAPAPAGSRVLAVSPLAAVPAPSDVPPSGVVQAGPPPPRAPPPPLPAERIAALPPAPAVSAPPLQPEPPPEPPKAAQPAAAAAPSPPPPAAAPPERLAALPPAGVSAKGFLWPVRGRVISGFGTDSEGIHNDGINIAAPAGTPVLAADAGEVAYAGNELKGYGNLILLKHANGMVSAYAHNETLLVKRGDKVARGQPIAKVGATGAVSQPQLHFELRRGAKPLDPADYLPENAATASR
jgi:murein DD-endopeptidase MepM/ murein hydrolase activator NlpD